MVKYLDQARSKLLSRTLRVEALRGIYRSKASRIQVLFLFALFLNLVIALIAPKLLFYLSPLLLGVPHLFASYRFSTQQKSDLDSNNRISIYLTLSGGLGVLAYLQAHSIFSDLAALFIPISLLLSIWALLPKVRALSRPIASLAVGLLVLPMSLFYPREIALTLLLGHNLIAFIFWLKSATSPQERRVVKQSFILTLLALITSGVLISHDPALAPSLQECSDLLLGSQDQKHCFLMHFFLVSQSVHYFIWLKAIPDFQSTSATPGGFAYSARQLKKHFGRVAIPTLALSLLGFLLVFLFLGAEPFRVAYVSLAAFHGLYEIAALFI